MLPRNCYGKAQGLLLLTGGGGVLGDPGVFLVWGRVCSGKVGVEDGVTSRSAPFTGGAAAHVFVNRAGADGVDVFLVRPVFSFLAVAGPVAVDNSLGERRHFENFTADVF